MQFASQVQLTKESQNWISPRTVSLIRMVDASSDSHQGEDQVDERARSVVYAIPLASMRTSSIESEEIALKQSLWKSLSDQSPIASTKLELRRLMTYYKSHSENLNAENALLELLQQMDNSRIDEKLVALDQLGKLYRNYTPQQLPAFLAEIKQMQVDPTLSAFYHWRVCESKADLYSAPKHRSKYISKVSKLADLVCGKDADYWSKLRVKLANLYAKSKQYTEGESVLWETFQQLQQTCPSSVTADRTLFECLQYNFTLVRNSEMDRIRLHSALESLVLRFFPVLQRVAFTQVESLLQTATVTAVAEAKTTLSLLLMIVQPQLTRKNGQRALAELLIRLEKGIKEFNLLLCLHYSVLFLIQKRSFYEEFEFSTKPVSLLLAKLKFAEAERVTVYNRRFRRFNIEWDMRKIYNSKQ